MKLTKHTLHTFIEHVEHNYAEGALTFYTRIAGYLVPISIIPFNSEPLEQVSTSILQLESMGITRDDIWEGVKRCKLLRENH